jgi:hypothetical protein
MFPLACYHVPIGLLPCSQFQKLETPDDPLPRSHYHKAEFPVGSLLSHWLIINTLAHYYHIGSLLSHQLIINTLAHYYHTGSFLSHWLITNTLAAVVQVSVAVPWTPYDSDGEKWVRV